MKRLVTNTLELFHNMIQNYVSSGDQVLDATAGNGNDTIILAESVGEEGKVYAVDLQQTAIDKTNARLIQAGLKERVELHCMNHAEIDRLVLMDLSLVIFNLGYLPGSEKKVTTQGVSTIQAIDASLRALRLQGLILITVYPGNDSGLREHTELQKYLQTLDQQLYDVMELKFPNRKNVSPYGVMIQKLR